jgi:hypothetical protein
VGTKGRCGGGVGRAMLRCSSGWSHSLRQHLEHREHEFGVGLDVVEEGVLTVTFYRPGAAS